MDFLELDKATQLSMVRSRIRQIEQDYFALDLRIKAPDLSVPISEQDRNNLITLESSLSTLRQMEQALSPSAPADNNPPTQPAGT